MNVLVVGVTGFLGSAIAEIARKNNTKVWGLLATKETAPTGIEEIFTINELPTASVQFDQIYLAVGNFKMQPAALREVTLTLTQLLMDLYPAAKIVYISSVDVYTQTTICTEKSEPHPQTPYSEIKLAGELIVKKHARYAIVRLTYLYAKNTPNNSFLPKVIADALNKKMITLTNTGERAQDYLHISDAAELCWLAGQYEYPEIFLGATGISLTNKEIAESIIKKVPNGKIQYIGSSTAPSQYLDPKWTMKTLNWHPKYSLLDYINEMVAV